LAKRRVGGLWLSAGFALGIAVDAVSGALFGLAGFAVLRVLASSLAIAYALLGIILAVTGLALLRVVHIVNPGARSLPKSDSELCRELPARPAARPVDVSGLHAGLLSVPPPKRCR
jgi:hypothetical protein